MEAGREKRRGRVQGHLQSLGHVAGWTHRGKPTIMRWRRARNAVNRSSSSIAADARLTYI